MPLWHPWEEIKYYFSLAKKKTLQSFWVFRNLPSPLPALQELQSWKCSPTQGWWRGPSCPSLAPVFQPRPRWEQAPAGLVSRTRQDYKYPLQADVGYLEQRKGDCFRSWWDSLKGVESMQIQQAKWSAGRRVGLWTLWDFTEVFRNRASPTWLEGWWEVFPQAWVWIWWTLKVFAAPWFCGQD